MSLSIAADAALVVVDMQQAFGPPFWEHWGGPGGRRNNPEVEQVVGDLLTEWRCAGRPVIHVRHDSVDPGSPLRREQPGHAFFPETRPRDGEPVYAKSVNSAFIGTTLEADLRRRGLDTLVLVGIQTDHCVSTTARMAGNLGFRTFVVADGTATFDRVGPNGRRYPAELMHDTALASLHGEFATVITAAVLRNAYRQTPGAAPR